MSKTELLVALSVVSLAAACKSSGSGLQNQPGKPNVAPAGSQVTLTCGNPDPTTLVVTCNVDFGGVPIGQSVTTNLSIGNESASSYEITEQTLPTGPQFTAQQLQELPSPSSTTSPSG